MSNPPPPSGRNNSSSSDFGIQSPKKQWRKKKPDAEESVISSGTGGESASSSSSNKTGKPLSPKALMGKIYIPKKNKQTKDEESPILESRKINPTIVKMSSETGKTTTDFIKNEQESIKTTPTKHPKTSLEDLGIKSSEKTSTPSEVKKTSTEDIKKSEVKSPETKVSAAKAASEDIKKSEVKSPETKVTASTAAKTASEDMKKSEVKSPETKVTASTAVKTASEDIKKSEVKIPETKVTTSTAAKTASEDMKKSEVKIPETKVTASTAAKTASEDMKKSEVKSPETKVTASTPVKTVTVDIKKSEAKSPETKVSASTAAKTASEDLKKSEAKSPETKVSASTTAKTASEDLKNSEIKSADKISTFAEAVASKDTRIKKSDKNVSPIKQNEPKTPAKSSSIEVTRLIGRETNPLEPSPLAVLEEAKTPPLSKAKAGKSKYVDALEDLPPAAEGDPTTKDGEGSDTASMKTIASSVEPEAGSGNKRECLYKILVIGELGTGKTSIIKRYVHQFFSQHYRATIGVDFALKVLNWDQNTIIRLQLWDIAGQERFGNMTRVYYKEAVGAFIVFDVTRAATFDAVVKWKQDLDAKVQLPDGSPIPCVLLANKCDQQKEGLVNHPNKMNEYCEEHKFTGWFETSAKENINIEEAAKTLVDQIVRNDSSNENGVNGARDLSKFPLESSDDYNEGKSCNC